MLAKGSNDAAAAVDSIGLDDSAKGSKVVAEVWLGGSKKGSKEAVAVGDVRRG